MNDQVNNAAVAALTAAIFAQLKEQIGAFVKESVKKAIDEEQLIKQDDLDNLEDRVGAEIDERIEKALDNYYDGSEFASAVEDVVRNMEVEVRIR